MIFGLNSDDLINQVDGLVAFIPSLGIRPTVGVVCDPGMPASYYLRSCKKLSAVADILLRPFDSSSLMVPQHGLRRAKPPVPRYSILQYEDRAHEYASALGPLCGKTGGLECGNEITLPAAFVGPNISAQVRAAIKICDEHELHSFVCYFWDNDNPTNLSLSAKAWKLRPSRAGVSIYPRTYEFPMTSQLPAVTALYQAHPDIPIGILEFGTQDSNGDDSAADGAHLIMVEQYIEFQFQNAMAEYFGGGFEWDAATYLLDSERGPSEKALYQRLAKLPRPWRAI